MVGHSVNCQHLEDKIYCSVKPKTLGLFRKQCVLFGLEDTCSLQKKTPRPNITPGGQKSINLNKGGKK